MELLKATQLRWHGNCVGMVDALSEEGWPDRIGSGWYVGTCQELVARLGAWSALPPD